MYIHIAEILKGKMLAAGSNVALTIPISLQNAIDDGYHHIVPDIELPVVIEQSIR
jgi:hypothetical protein